VIKVTARGSAVHETLFPPGARDDLGSDLVMTHYCVLGNQPRMKADPKSPANQIVWKFDCGGNLDSKKDKHMHEAMLTISTNGGDAAIFKSIALGLFLG
jgi:hypothetical protein